MMYKNKNYSLDFKKTFIQLDQTIKDALKNLNISGSKLCIVVDKKYLFKGVLNDGDIRRALLKGKTLYTKIKYIYNKNPFVLKENFNKKIALKKLKLKTIDQAPIINKKKVLGVFNIDKSIFQNLDVPVVIMSGGYGLRLKPFTLKVPKALINIKKVPMLSIVIDNIKKFGFKNFILTTFYKSKKIKDFYKNGKNLGVNINYIKENKPLGTAGSLSLLKNKIKQKNFLLTNCDVLSEINYRSLLDFHIKNKADLTIAVKRYVSKNNYGEISIKGIRVKSIVEKPKNDIIINSGIYVLKNKCLKFLKYNQHKDMNELITLLIKNKKKVIAFPFYDDWFDLGTKDQLRIYREHSV